MTNGALNCVEPGKKFGTFGDGLLKAPPGNAKDVGQGHAHQGFSGGKRHRPWHVADGVVLDAVDGHGGMGVGGFLAGGDTTSLIDRYIHDH